MKRKPRVERSRRCSLERLEPRIVLSSSPVVPPAPPVESITGAGVNLQHPTYGQAGNDLVRAAYYCCVDHSVTTFLIRRFGVGMPAPFGS